MRRQELDRQVLFGIALGTVTFVLGYGHGLLVTGTETLPWKALAVCGPVAIAIAVAIPSLWAWPERRVRTAATALQELALRAILVLAFLLVICPFGALLRRTRGRTPIYEWDSAPPETIEGWQRKRIETSGGRSTAGRRRSAFGLVFSVVGLFLRRRQVWLLPALVLLLVLGLLMFFVANSAFAPFIYPLF